MERSELRALTALAFLHDIGKLAPGFQAKGWLDQKGIVLRGHLEAGWLWSRTVDARSLAGAASHLVRWSGIGTWLLALFAHHGRPVAEPGSGMASPFYVSRDFPYDWKAEETRLGEALLTWFPDLPELTLPHPSPRLVHFFCGLLTLADWIGSDQRAFPFEETVPTDYWVTAHARAERRLAEIGLGPSGLRLLGPPGWALISDHPAPRPAQAAVGEVPTDDRLVLLEAETGVGKTEAALWRFVCLVAAGEVDALYFAVPTRAAARQLQRRINNALQRMFVDPPEAVLAIPGQVKAGEAAGTRLPDFTVLWDDEEERPSRWAAEHSARFLAARIAVGSIDQVALGGLKVKFAHLRGTALSRALLVIDEVHASDAYMTTVQTAMARDHLALGGHVLLMSATLGAAARAQWFNQQIEDPVREAAVPYPAIWTSRGVQAVVAETGAGKTVEIQASAGWTGGDAARFALDYAGQGARVLVIRNTVARAQETYAACMAEAAGWILQLNNIPTLHHGRFAAEDRARLDDAVERAIGKDSPLGSRIVIGTQTLEQSLDLCADILITDLCPMDVLLQRIGRLHRHGRTRPAGFQVARAIVLIPRDGLDGLTRKAENGLGSYSDGATLTGIYLDVPGLAATLSEIETRPEWHLPAMNRSLVEAATHPVTLEALANLRGWQEYSQRVIGKRLGDRATARLGLLDRAQPLEAFPDDQSLRTRLGEDGLILRLPENTRGAFGHPVSTMALPAGWSRGLTGDEPIELQEEGPGLRLRVGHLDLTYGPAGLSREGGTER